MLVTLNFWLPRALPGQPIETLSDPRSQTFVADAATRAELERYYGLDAPPAAQYGRYMQNLATPISCARSSRHGSRDGCRVRRVGWTASSTGSRSANS